MEVKTIILTGLLDGAPNGLASACNSILKRRVNPEGKADLIIDDVPGDPSDDADLHIGIWINKKYYPLPSAPDYTVEIKKHKGISTTFISNPYYREKKWK